MERNRKVPFKPFHNIQQNLFYVEGNIIAENIYKMPQPFFSCVAKQHQCNDNCGQIHPFAEWTSKLVLFSTFNLKGLANMMYDTLLARSFSKSEQKKLRYGAMVACFFLALSVCTFFKHCIGPLPFLNLQLSTRETHELDIVDDGGGSLLTEKEISLRDDKAIVVNETSRTTEEVTMKNLVQFNDSSRSKRLARDAEVAINHKFASICNTTERSHFCDVKGDIRVDGISSTVFVVTSEMDILAAENTSWIIRPYARKGDITAMSDVKEWSVKLASDRKGVLQCTQNHNVPAVLFSTGGYSGNHFHAFTDIMIPLYSTARLFNGEVKFLITDRAPWWMAKFEVLVKALSRYEIIDIDKSADIHCFPGIVAGLKRLSRKELTVDPSISGFSMEDFREFLRNSYSLEKKTAMKIRVGETKRPKLLIVSRRKSRAFTNVDEIGEMATRLGYNVVVAEPGGNLAKFAQIINSCDVVVGVHGAGLTNILFLPDNAILIQVVPFGCTEWLSKVSFGEPSKDMNLRYLEYKIELEESSLIKQYPADHVVLRDPWMIQKQGWDAYKSVYLDKQNVKLDLNRFKPTLLKALQLLQQ